MEEVSKKPLLAVTTSLECPSPSPTLQLPHPPSPSSSEVSIPSSNSDQPTDATQDPELPPKHSQGSPSNSSHTPAKLERMTSTGPDALKKTVKDLQRSSVSLPRFQLLLEEVNDIIFSVLFVSCKVEQKIQLHSPQVFLRIVLHTCTLYPYWT